MVNIDDYGDFETAWCPGCGNFAIRDALRQALADSGLEPHQVVIVSGIGQAAKMPHYIRCNCFNGLHGRSLPAATGVRLANPAIKVICESGDGCTYGEGGNHLLAALRRNMDLTVLAHNNQIYGLTKGQASPTSMEGMKTKAQPGGVYSQPFNPVAEAVSMRANFVARGFAGDKDHLAGLISQALAHPGFALVDIMQPCVSFNKLNTYKWYKERVYQVGHAHDPSDWDAALKLSFEFGKKIPIGVIYKGERQAFGEHYPVLQNGPLCAQAVDKKALAEIIENFA